MSEKETWRIRVGTIHLKLSTIHRKQAILADTVGLSAEYIEMGKQAIELDRELSTMFWEMLGLKDRSTEVPFTKQPLRGSQEEALCITFTYLLQQSS
jgi:hypothetical protein